MSDVAVITGGASGLGHALSEDCAAHGMHVALLDRDGERAVDQAAALASAHGIEALGLAVDVGDDASVRAAADAVSERFGRADLVVSNVGVQLLGAFDHFTESEWQWVLNVNVFGGVRTAREFLPLLRASPHGRLAFTTSASVLSPGSRMAPYQTSKFAVWGLAEALRVELADEISVSVVFPSGMISRQLETSEEAKPEPIRRPIAEPEDFEVMRESNPGLSRDVATPEQAAAGVLDAILAGERYIVTHGDLVDPVIVRCEELRRAAELAKGNPIATL